MNALDGHDLAGALLSRKAMRRLTLGLLIAVALGIWVGALSTDQVGAFLYDQSRHRAEELLEPLLAGVLPTSTIPTTTIAPLGG